MSTEFDSKWQATKSDYPIGQKVTGKVVVNAHYGTWIDLDIGFPALLEVIVMDEHTLKKNRDNNFALSKDVIESTIIGYADSRRQIYLKQDNSI